MPEYVAPGQDCWESVLTWHLSHGDPRVMGHGHSRLDLPERLFQDTGDGSGQCPRARLRELSPNHICRLLSVRAVTELLPRRFEQVAEGTFCGRNDRICNHICPVPEREKEGRLRESEKGKWFACGLGWSSL